MPKIPTLTAALLLALAMPALAKDAVSKSGGASFQAQFEEALGPATKGDVATSCKAMDTLRRHPELETMPTRKRVEARLIIAAVYWGCSRYDDGLAEVQAANAMTATAHGKLLEAMLADAGGKPVVAVDALLAFARSWPRDANFDAVDLALRVHRSLAADPAQQTRLLQGLFDAGFEPIDADAGELWFELARLQLDAGDVARGKAAATRVMGLRHAARMRIDRRFDPVLSAAPELGDLRAQSVRLMDAMAAKLEASPNAMAPRVAMAEEWVLLGDYEKAVAAIDDAIAAVRPGDEGSWTGLQLRLGLARLRSTAHLRQGKQQQALDDTALIRAFLPPGAPDFASVVRADLLCDLGRGSEAGRALDVDVSGIPSAEQAKLKVGVCVATLAGDTARARALLNAMQGTLAPDQQEALVSAYLRVGDVEAAAPRFIALLDAPATRSDALVWAQNDPRTPDLPGMVEYRKAFDAMLARPDVKAALEKYGRVLTWDLYLGLE